MSQAPPLIGPNKSGLTYRQEDNDGKQALLTHHKGPSAPTYAQAGTLWLDDAATPWLLKMYDGVDWICLSQINAGSNTVLPYAGVQASRGLHLHDDSGSLNAYAAALSPTVSSYTAGLTVLLKAAHTNTGACTLAIDGLSAVAVKMPDGGNAIAGALRANGIYLLCYDGANFKLLNPSQAQTPAVLQTQTATYSSYALLATTLPFDDTIPTSTEGTEIMSVSITPMTATSKMVIRAAGFGACGLATNFSCSVVVHGESSAFAASTVYAPDTNYTNGLSILTEHVPGSLSPITYKLRVGAGSGWSRPNSNGAGRMFGGIARWQMVVEEYSQ